MTSFRHASSTRRNALRALPLILVASLAVLTGCDNIPATVKIGVAQPLSGGEGAQGQDLLNGVTLAVAELNKEGFKIKGKPVTLEIVSMDDKGDPDTGKEVAQKMLDAGVVAVIGNLNSGVSIASAPIYASKDIAQLSISTNPKFTQLGLATTYRLVANDSLQAKAISAFATGQLNAVKYAVVDDGTPYGKDLADGAADLLKIAKKEIVVRQSFDDKTTAFEGLAKTLKQGGVEVVVTTLNDFQMLALLNTLKTINYTQLIVLGSDTIKTTDMIKGAGIVKGLYATSPILDAKEFVTGKQFLAKYQQAFKMAPAYGGHYTYDAMHVLANAMKRAESADPKKITQTLRTLDGYAPVTGSMKWDAVGEQRYGVVGVYSVRGSDWELRVRSDMW
jgi:branched-chain amino acid transport system substrate-binding protein